MKRWIRPLLALTAIAIVADGFAIAIVALTYLYSGHATEKCFPSGFLHAQWPKWIWCTFAAHESLTAGLLSAAGALIAACIAAYAVWLQLRASIQIREEDRIEKVLPAYIEAAQVLSDFMQIIPKLVTAGNARSFADQIEAVPSYIQKFMLSADSALKFNTENLVKAALNSALEYVETHSERADISFQSVFSILSRRTQYLNNQIQIMERRRKSARDRFEYLLP
jgi:hypothetical protein